MDQVREAFIEWADGWDHEEEIDFLDSMRDEKQSCFNDAAGFYGGYHSRDAEIESLKAEIATLKNKIKGVTERPSEVLHG